ncbi:MAG: sugar ABC transporter permease [Chloroflexi bacterium]|uniref:hypothetical protein n=1 Tax=Candidatus Flexifilum breve TaxID=3140694 RepID=UPI0031359171|nr:sugar ABC transporter permease [Chloroflexota bacterium]
MAARRDSRTRSSGWSPRSPFRTLGGLALALALRTQLRGARLFGSPFYLPTGLSPVVVGQIRILIHLPCWGFQPDASTASASRIFRRRGWASLETALASVIVAGGWQQTGLAMVIFSSPGWTSKPTELLEAAQIDGANYRQSLLRVGDSAPAARDGRGDRAGG